LEIEFRDGTRAVIATDRTWKTTVGPILENDLLMGESYDARQELGAWSQPGFDASGWWPVSVHPAPEIELSLSEGPPVRRIEELFAESPRLLSRHENELRIFDLKQNFCGRVRITVRAQRGVTVVLRFAEILNPDGTLYTENLRGARATDHYTCKGDVEEKWEPRFTFHGFRYVEVSGLQAGNQIEVVGVVLHSDMTPIGDFSCSISFGARKATFWKCPPIVPNAMSAWVGPAMPRSSFARLPLTWTFASSSINGCEISGMLRAQREEFHPSCQRLCSPWKTVDRLGRMPS
jgi:alpha-L-rhamnosidase